MKLALGGALFNVVMRLGGLVVSLASMAILARLLLPVDYGIFGIIVLCTGLASIIPDAISSAVIQSKTSDADEISGAFCIVLATSLALSVAVFCATPFIQNLWKDVPLASYAPLLSVLIVCTSVGTFFDGVQSKLLRFKQIALVQFLLQNLAQAVLTIALAALGFGAWSLLIGFALTAFAKVAVQLSMGMAAYVRPKKVPSSLRRPIFWLTGVHMCNFGGCNGDNIIVANFLGPAALGLYGRAYNLMNRPANVLGGSITGIFYPIISSLDSNLERVRTAYLKAIAFSALLTMPAATFAYVHSPEIVATMLGDKWLEVIPAFQFLITSLYFRLAYKVTEALTISRGAFKGTLFRQAIYGAAVLTGAFFGASFGIDGVAAAVTVVLFLFFVLSATYANRLCGVSLFQFAHAQAMGLVVAAAIAAVMIPMREMLLPEIATYAVLAIDAVVAALVFAGCLWLRPLWATSPLSSMIDDMRKRVLKVIGA